MTETAAPTAESAPPDSSEEGAANTGVAKMPPLWRGAILVGERQTDIVFPAAVPIRAAMQALIKLLNKDGATRQGYTPMPETTAYELQQVNGITLDPSRSLLELGVEDGVPLVLKPGVAKETFKPVTEDRSANLAKQVEQETAEIKPEEALVYGGVGVGILVAAASALLMRTHLIAPNWWPAWVICVGLAVAMLAAGWGTGRNGNHEHLRDALVLGALIPAVAAAATGLPGPLGAAHAWLAWLLTAAILVVLRVSTDRWWWLSTFVITLGVGLGAGAGVRWLFGVSGPIICACLMWVVLPLVLAAPSLANRLAGLRPPDLELPTGAGVWEHNPEEPDDTVSPVVPATPNDQPYPDVVSPEDLRRRNRHSITAHRAIIAALMVQLVATTWGAIHAGMPRLWMIELVAGLGLISLLGRAWITRDSKVVAALIGGILISGAVIVAKLAISDAQPVAATVTALGLLAAAVVAIGVLTALVGLPGQLSPPTRRALQFVYLLAMSLGFPFLLWGIGLLMAVRSRG
ncbi:type VII secretion integral membrane protein EccD [Mycobacteroides abscessus]|uniref:type VII secretion integral membrane protein EccD n=1 Tax=Mycobacteroides abscessus TaxID=36809 RepID=UPI0018776B81|nr:type VII secretion integral membrane protein EccD [Mycobacteroides abscessus]